MLVRSPLFFVNHTLRSVVFVFTLLALAFVFTGFASSFYRRERQSLGETHYELGNQYQAMHKPNQAVDEYRRALLYSPDLTANRVSLVNTLIDAKRYDEAQTHLTQLLQEDPTNGGLNMMLARLAALRHQTQEAIDYYQRAVYEYWPASQAEERRRGRWELINLLGQAGRRNEAVGELMQLYANAPPDPALRAKTGLLLLKYGATSEASQVFRDLVRDSPQNAEAHRGLGQAYFDSGEYVSARHEYERATRLNPKDQESANGLTLTNVVIQIDPALPDISSSQRYRRTQNLLRRILNDLSGCQASGDVAAEIAQAQGMLDANAKQATSTDPVLDMQNIGQKLWSDRALFCPETAPADTAVDAVLNAMKS